jgi:hypothetical protein
MFSKLATICYCGSAIIFLSINNMFVVLVLHTTLFMQALSSTLLFVENYDCIKNDKNHNKLEK